MILYIYPGPEDGFGVLRKPGVLISDFGLPIADLKNYKNMTEEELKNRTKKFALSIIKLVEDMPQSKAGNTVGNQIIRSCRKEKSEIGNPQSEMRAIRNENNPKSSIRNPQSQILLLRLLLHIVKVILDVLLFIFMHYQKHLFRFNDDVILKPLYHSHLAGRDVDYVAFVII